MVGAVICCTNSKFGDYVERIYAIKLDIEDTTDTVKSGSYLDLYLEIDNEGRLKFKLYDRKDDFSFPIVKFPFSYLSDVLLLYGMDYKDIFITAVVVALCLVANLSCCEKEEFVTCQRENMTCLQKLCRCYNRAPLPFYEYFDDVLCTDLTEVPKDITHDARFLSITGTNITTIRRGDFNNMPNVDRLYLNDNKISIIEPGGFVNLSNFSLAMNLDNNNLSRITAYMFRDISITTLYLQGNPITVIETHAFFNLPLLSIIRFNGNTISEIEKEAFVNIPVIQTIVGITPFLKKIETEAFVNLSRTALSLELYLAGNNNTVIQKNAFMNVHFKILVLGSNTSIKENRLITVSSYIEFSGGFTQCDCDLMWLVYLRHDKQLNVSRYSACTNNHKQVSALVPDDFHCMDNVSTTQHCNASESVDLPCEYNYLTTNLIRWIHSRNGTFIRELNKDLVDEDTHTLHFSFCNDDDSGEYMCMLSTDYSLLPNINRSVHLLVNGPPIVLNQRTEDDGDDLILSVVFYSIPYDFNIQWLLGNNSLNGDPQYTIAVNNMTVVLKQYNVDVTTDGFISNLTIHNFKRRPSDVYTCKISNQYGLIIEQIILGPASLELERRTYCDTSHSIELKCTLELVGATPVPWVHSNAGETIRALEGRHVGTSNILTIPFCNSQDTGDYTCRWKTDILGQTIMEKSTTLAVSGSPFVISYSSSVDVTDTIFSVTFFSIPFPSDPKWYYNNEPVALGTKFLQTTTYSIVQIKQHRVLVNVEGFVSNLTVHKAEYGLYNCVIRNSFGEVNQLFLIEQEQNKFSISTTEANTSAASTGDSVTVIIAICSSVVGIAVVVICSIIFIKRSLSLKSECR
ncbi:uncharacterized protein LOC134688187 [Mytilus trossulus]|uniref:uncharacterized protein LOC134688187 n=1 Tax=Mytilus trossulus TaxID=6551 RepID=UPI0030057D80